MNDQDINIYIYDQKKKKKLLHIYPMRMDNFKCA